MKVWRPPGVAWLLGALVALLVAGCSDDDATPSGPSAGSTASGCTATVASASVVQLPGGITLTRTDSRLSIRDANGNSVQASWPPSGRLSLSGGPAGVLELDGAILTTPNGCVFDVTGLFG